ncbi:MULTISPECIES: primosomal protein DnaI [unclassified Gemella]|uniref:primosomal protein DnaI n=1 Tax=unclassified Gemella TaxID=2624949 RepID=UPI001C047EE5|nr:MULTISPECIES: primosomal protein DnaI [unclassified Gemella]MBU0278792.1 primosomal protein DnaI [Gemella sp. zg-1178]QWQ39342.1 primosomal protein DnaI [Gemella sp. zg-570]
MKKISSITKSFSEKINVEEFLTNNILKDKDILKFIKKNNINDEIFENNKQIFFDFYLSKNKAKEIEYLPKLKYNDGTVYLEFSETPKQKKLNEERKWSNRIKTEYISKGILYSNFANVSKNINKIELSKKLIDICDEHLAGRQTRGIYVYGKTGIGKSYLMGCVYNYLKDKGKEPAIIYFPEFVRKIKTMISSGDYTYVIDSIREQDILIIDDIGAENITEFVRDEILVPIINYRSSENLLTFFTSNLGIVDLSDFLSVTKNTIDETKAMRILDRIRYLASPIYLDCDNERTK